jgi:hypothetical protein
MVISMAERKRPSRAPRDSGQQIIGLRLAEQLAIAVKMEATRRKIPVNRLFVEMWELYMKQQTKK